MCALGCDALGVDDEAVGCGFGESHLVAEATGPLFHDLTLVATAHGPAVIWSDRSGLFLRPLGPHGRPRGPARRLGPACPGGVAGDAVGDALDVACLRPADRDRARPGGLTLLRVQGPRFDGARPHRLGETGPVGSESAGVDVVHHGGRVLVGWRDADVFTARARVASLEGGAIERDPTPLSTRGVLASAPSLHVVDGALLRAWTESWFDARGAPTGHLLVQRDDGPPMPSLDVADVDVRVHLTADARGPIVAMRDRRPRGARHRSFVGRLDERLALAERHLHSPARADAHGGRPMIVPCGDHVFSVATRRSSRQVTMVTLRRLDADLRPVEDEQQIYEYHARFPQAVGLCVDDRLLVAVGERQSEARREPRLRTYELRCGPGVEHERTPGTEGNARGRIR
ncbi:MAG TPA: hypothetical protein RMH99_07430 [Sandaracinaceae bacterium LLY-WYZ-13_1]|nr:hypothetical protein [Sandaracinaceae bacterium LLY-WYZ-13_1]